MSLLAALFCCFMHYFSFLFFPSRTLQENVYDNNTIHSIKITLANVSREDNNVLLTCTATNMVGMTNASVLLSVHCEY